MTTLIIFLIILAGTFISFFILSKIWEADFELIAFITFLFILAVKILLYLFIDFSVINNLVFLLFSIFLVYLFYSLRNSARSILIEGNKNKIDQLTNSIYRNRKILFQRIKSDSHLNDYFYLKLEYEKGNIKNKNFQERYKSFYRMHLFGFTQEFYDKYFQFLSEGETDLKKILKELSKIENESGKKTVQLAFASKLVHMVDSKKPLYNSTVSDIFNISVKRGSIKIRIKSSIEAYQELEKKYKKLLEKERIQEAINEFRQKFNFKEGILSDYKLLDLILHKVSKL